jgi:hypothetical protein
MQLILTQFSSSCTGFPEYTLSLQHTLNCSLTEQTGICRLHRKTRNTLMTFSLSQLIDRIHFVNKLNIPTI